MDAAVASYQQVTAQLAASKRRELALAAERDKLADEVARLREEARWIPVAERLPEQREERRGTECFKASDLVEVYVQGDDGKLFVLDDVLVDGKWVNFPSPKWEVTHWRPLPQGPEDGRDE
jgi:hypothetical protein